MDKKEQLTRDMADRARNDFNFALSLAANTVNNMTPEEFAEAYSATFDENEQRIIISAEVHSDDHLHEVTFNALPWFEAATDEEIFALYQIGWGGEAEADAVALALESSVPDIAALYQYTLTTKDFKNPVGYECDVESDDAMAWLQTNRPELYARIQEAERNGSW
jgi:hypothetical protein